jgi:hypothetical protein
VRNCSFSQHSAGWSQRSIDLLSDKTTSHFNQFIILLKILDHPTAMDTISTPRTLFSLPLEIREIIYGYLTPPSRLPTVLRSRYLGVSSVSHRPPPLDLLLSCRQFYVEALDVYYRKSVFKFDGLLDPANVWPLWQIEEVLGGSELGRVTLANMRKVELNLFWHLLPNGGVANAAIANVGSKYGNLCKSEGDKRVERLGRAVQVLKNAYQLKSVIVTWKEIPARNGEKHPDWELKEKILRSLGALTGTRIVAGDIVASEEVETAVTALIQELNQFLSCSKDGAGIGTQLTQHREYVSWQLGIYLKISIELTNYLAGTSRDN